MADADLVTIFHSKSEDLDVEYKSWMDISDKEVKAKLARHLAALANYGGGYLIFGVNNETRMPEGATALDRSLFGEDAISDIVKAYLDPTFQCRVSWIEDSGVEYPIVIVPGHGPRRLLQNLADHMTQRIARLAFNKA